MRPLEGELDGLPDEIGLKLAGDVDVRGLAGGVLDDQEQLGDDLDDVSRLENEVPLAALHALGRQASRNVGLTA